MKIKTTIEVEYEFVSVLHASLGTIAYLTLEEKTLQDPKELCKLLNMSNSKIKVKVEEVK